MISIIIPTLNEENYLPKLLDSIKKQTYKDYEIIVADGNSKDNTRKIARKYNCKIVPGGSPSRGRNHGAEHAKGDYLLFLDADVILPKTFLKKIYVEFEKRFLDVATAEYIPLSGKNIDKIMSKVGNKFISATQYLYPHGGGFCIFCTKRMFKRVNGFDESLTMAEDHDFLGRCTKVGGRFRLLKSSKFKMSIRRMIKEGRMELMKKYIISEFHMLFKGKIREDLFEYEFGEYEHLTKKQKKSLFKKQISLLRKKAKELELKYNQLFKSKD